MSLADVIQQIGEPDSAVAAETQRRLREAFDMACGDAFCEGEYPDVAALRLACSVNSSTEEVSRCTWTFALADSSVDARGRIDARTTTRTCPIEIGAPAAALTTALSGTDPLHAPLPGKSTSLYDALVGCM